MVSNHAVTVNAEAEKLYVESVNSRNQNVNGGSILLITNNKARDTKQQIESQNSALLPKKSPTIEHKLSTQHIINTTTNFNNVNSFKLQRQFAKYSGSKSSHHSKRFHDNTENNFSAASQSVIPSSTLIHSPVVQQTQQQHHCTFVDKRRKSFNSSANSGTNIIMMNNNNNKVKTHHHTKSKSQTTSNATTYNNATIDNFPSSYIYSILEKLSPCPDFKSYIEIKWITTITPREIQVELFRPKVLNINDDSNTIDEDGRVSRKLQSTSNTKPTKQQKFLLTTISRLKSEQTTNKVARQDSAATTPTGQPIEFKDEESNSSGEDSTTDVSSNESSYHDKAANNRNQSESDDCSSSSGQESQSKHSHSFSMNKKQGVTFNDSNSSKRDEEIQNSSTERQQNNSNQQEGSQKKKKDFLVQGGVLRLPTALSIFSKLFNSMKAKISLNRLVFTPFNNPNGKSNHSTTEDYQGGSSSGAGTSSSGSEGLSSSSDGGNSSSNSSGDERDDASSEEDRNEDSYPMPPVNVLTVSGSGESSSNSQNGGSSSHSSERRNNSSSNNGGGTSNNSSNNNNSSREASSNSMNNSSSGSEEFSGSSDSDDENVSFATVHIIDGSQKEKNGIKYWVQRNVITIQVISSFVFDTCTVYCTKEGSSETKVMETLSFVDSFTKLNPAKVSEVLKNAQCNISIDEDDVYEAQFRKKLPFTSGRPETQKLIWISAEFSMSNKIIKKVNSSKFYVCSRPQDLRAIGNTPAATSTTNGSTSVQSTSATPGANTTNSHHHEVSSIISPQPQHSFSARTKVATSQLNVQSPSMNSNPMPHFQNDGYRQSSNNSQDGNSNIHNSTSRSNYNNFANGSNNSGSAIHHHYSNSNVSNSNTSNSQQQMFPSNQYPHHPFTSPNSPIYHQQHHHHSQTPSTTNYQSSPQQNNGSIQLTSIHPNRGPLNGQQEVTLLGNFDSIKKEGNSVRVMFGLQDSPSIRQVLSDRIICSVPERIVPGLVRIEVVTKSIPQLSSFGDVFYTYYRPEQNQQENENQAQASDNEGFSLNRTNKSHIYHPYK